jgi:hypothetical protein
MKRDHKMSLRTKLGKAVSAFNSVKDKALLVVNTPGAPDAIAMTALAVATQVIK